MIEVKDPRVRKKLRKKKGKTYLENKNKKFERAKERESRLGARIGDV